MKVIMNFSVNVGSTHLVIEPAAMLDTLADEPRREPLRPAVK